MGYPLEYFNPNHFVRWSSLSGSIEVTDILNYVKSRRTSANGCFGFKAHFSDFAAAISAYPFDAIFPGCRFILIDRDDLLGQAISLVRARQTNQWISVHERQREATYSFEEISRAMIYLLEEKASWLRFFALTGRKFLRVTYESLLTEPAKAIQDIGHYLDLSPVEIHGERVLPQKQADQETDCWRDQFLRETAELSVGHACKRLCLTE